MSLSGSAQTLDSVPESTETDGTSTAPSVAASTIAGGSQPVLPSSRRTSTGGNEGNSSWSAVVGRDLVDELVMSAAEQAAVSFRTLSSGDSADVSYEEATQAANTPTTEQPPSQPQSQPSMVQFSVQQREIEETNARNLANLSMSAPDLAARQSSAPAAATGAATTTAASTTAPAPPQLPTPAQIAVANATRAQQTQRGHSHPPTSAPPPNASTVIQIPGM